MARESSKLGLNPGRYRRGIRAQVVQFRYEVRCFHCVLGFGNKMPSGFRFDLVSERAKCIESDK